MDFVTTSDAPTPGGHYSQAVVHGGLVYVAGQLPLDPAQPRHVPSGVEDQADRALLNLRAILEAAGSGLSRLLQVTIYITDISLWPQVNEAYARHLGAHRPARAVVPVNTLHFGCLLEIQAIAALHEK